MSYRILVHVSILSLFIWNTKAKNHSELNEVDSDATSESRNQIGIIAANSFRKLHGVLPLEYNAELASHATKWAEKVLKKIVKEGKLKPYYSHPFIEGENVIVLEGPLQPLSLGSAISQWYSESKKYNFTINKFLPSAAQFTQLVWKETTKIGLGTAYDSEKNWLVVVARFKPVGNTGYHNSFAMNVFPPTLNHSEVKPSRSESVPVESEHDGGGLATRTISNDIKTNKTAKKQVPMTSPTTPASAFVITHNTSPTRKYNTHKVTSAPKAVKKSGTAIPSSLIVTVNPNSKISPSSLSTKHPDSKNLSSYDLFPNSKTASVVSASEKIPKAHRSTLKPEMLLQNASASTKPLAFPLTKKAGNSNSSRSSTADVAPREEKKRKASNSGKGTIANNNGASVRTDF